MAEKEEKLRELYVEYQALEQHIKQVHKQLEALTSQLLEAHSTYNSLEEFAKIKKDQEIFVPLSSGIFAKASAKDSSELLVNVGAGIVVSKDQASTKKLVSGQIDEMKKLHQKMVEELEKLTEKSTALELQLQSLANE